MSAACERETLALVVAQLALRVSSSRSSIFATRRAMRARLTTEGEGVKPSSLSKVERAVDVEVNTEKITFSQRHFSQEAPDNRIVGATVVLRYDP
jgi:hypothetical protein